MARRNGTVVEAAPPRELSDEQALAVAALLAGSSDADAAQQAGVSARSISRWRSEPLFAAELNRQRAQIWRNQADRLRALMGAAIGIIESDIHSDDDDVRRAAARAVLRQYGGQFSLVPSGPTSAEAVEREAVFESFLG